jgi:23S rRNA pseudouridine2605 synthase
VERLQKILARGGVASRRAAERLITEGRVRVNGRVVTELGEKADPRRDRVEVDGKRVVAEAPVYVVLHKPRGVVSTMSDPEGRPTVHELLAKVGARVFPIGRLDFATSGVLLASNDGDFADGLLHPKRDVPKTYVVKVNGAMQADDLELWRRGVELEDGKTLPADAQLLRHEEGKTWIQLTIREGRNQQIRRMGEATGFPVMRLARVRFADVSIEGLAPGRYRHLSRDELVSLKKAYGVPRSVPAGMATAAAAEGATGRAAGGRAAGPGRKSPQARRGAQGRAARGYGREVDEGSAAGAAFPRGERPRREGPPARSDARGERPRREGPPARREGPPARSRGPKR